ncbi:MAG: hypothetical protein ABEI52_01245 [Halobacteriaceae archaeon]
MNAEDTLAFEAALRVVFRNVTSLLTDLLSEAVTSNTSDSRPSSDHILEQLSFLKSILVNSNARRLAGELAARPESASRRGWTDTIVSVACATSEARHWFAAFMDDCAKTGGDTGSAFASVALCVRQFHLRILLVLLDIACYAGVLDRCLCIETEVVVYAHIKAPGIGPAVLGVVDWLEEKYWKGIRAEADRDGAMRLQRATLIRRAMISTYSSNVQGWTYRTLMDGVVEILRDDDGFDGFVAAHRAAGEIPFHTSADPLAC